MVVPGPDDEGNAFGIFVDCGFEDLELELYAGTLWLYSGTRAMCHWYSRLD
jgi:hypothetical protein